MRKEPSWPRPSRAMSAKALSAFLETVRGWKEGRVEPVVGRIRETRPDPFAILVGTLLSLRTRDATTEKAFERLWPLAPTAEALAGLPLEALEAAIRPVGFYRTKARTLQAVARRLIERHGGRVPDDLDSLLSLPGVGRKTANLVLTEGFGKRGICVDTHVHRILNWWGFVATRHPDETEQVLRRTLPRRWWMSVNALLVSFGQEVCRPVGPRCGECPLAPKCPFPGKKSASGPGARRGRKDSSPGPAGPS
ncbi:MAG: endonuclease III domain-containing protein [Acidobacteriota bacterium]